MKERVFAGNEIVFREGDWGDCFYQILSGSAGIYLNYGSPDQKKLTEMKPGQYFGEMAVIEARPRSTTVVAEGDLKVIEIPESDLNAYFEQDPDRILAIMRQIGSRIRTLTEEYDEVTAFLKEKQEADAVKKPGFLARFKKYKDLNELAKKAAARPSAEDRIRTAQFTRPAGSPLPVTEFSKGTVIFRQDEAGSYMYAVHSGSVGIYTNYGTPLEKKLTTLFPNTFFGEMSLLDQSPRSAAAVAEEDGTVLEIIRPEDLKDLFRTNPAEIDMIMGHLSNRLRSLTLDYEKACEAAAADI